MIVICILGLALAGCVTRASAPTSFYMLTPLAPSAGKASPGTEAQRTIVAVEAVEIPAYLDRNQIVTRLSETQYHLAEFDQWTEPLGNTLARVIMENLSHLLSADVADVIPLSRSVPFDYSIKVGVIRLDGKPGDRVTLTTIWAIFGKEESNLILLRKSEYREMIQADMNQPKPQFQSAEDVTTREDYTALVMAQSRVVEKLSREIADAMKKILADRKKG